MSKWWDELTPAQQRAYLVKHPNSKLKAWRELKTPFGKKSKAKLDVQKKHRQRKAWYKK